MFADLIRIPDIKAKAIAALSDFAGDAIKQQAAKFPYSMRAHANALRAESNRQRQWQEPQSESFGLQSASADSGVGETPVMETMADPVQTPMPPLPEQIRSLAIRSAARLQEDINGRAADDYIAKLKDWARWNREQGAAPPLPICPAAVMVQVDPVTLEQKIVATAMRVSNATVADFMPPVADGVVGGPVGAPVYVDGNPLYFQMEAAVFSVPGSTIPRVINDGVGAVVRVKGNYYRVEGKPGAGFAGMWSHVYMARKKSELTPSEQKQGDEQSFE